MRRCALVVVAVSVLSGCAGQSGGWSRAMEYSWDVATVDVAGETYRVLEHPGNGAAGGRIMTTPSLGKATEIGMVRGATIGLGSVEPPIERHRAAARARLDATGRAGCRIVEGHELIDTQFEFVFACDPSGERTPPPQAPAAKRSSKA